MKIAIIGSGNVGSALATGWHKAGNKVVYGVRNPQSDKSKKAAASNSEIAMLSIDDAIERGDIIVITTPPQAITELIPYLQNAADKIIIDTTNSVLTKPDGYPTAYHALKALTNCANLVKCFNSTGFENMVNPVYRQSLPVVHNEQLDMFAAGDSIKAKETCRELAVQLGFYDCYDFGNSDKVELLEQFALSWINLAIMQGMGRNIAFKLIKRME